MTLKCTSTEQLGLLFLYIMPMMPSLTAKTCTFRLQSCAHAYTLNSTATEQHSLGSHTCAIFLNVNKYQFWLLRPVTSAGCARQWAIKRLFTAHLSYCRSFLIAASRRPFLLPYSRRPVCHITGQFLMTSISCPGLGLHSGITDVISLVDVIGWN